MTWHPKPDAKRVVCEHEDCESNLGNNRKKLEKLSNGLLSCDAARFDELRKRLLVKDIGDDDSMPDCIYIHCLASSEKSDIERCRAIAFATCEALLTSGDFCAVNRVSTKEELDTEFKRLPASNARGSARWFGLMCCRRSLEDQHGADRGLRSWRRRYPPADIAKGVSAEASFTPVEPFEAFDIGAAADPKLLVSTVHKEIKLLVEEGQGKPYPRLPTCCVIQRPSPSRLQEA